MADDQKLLAEWFWTDRWIGSSAFLLPIEARGLYREMLTQAWRRGARLPADAVTIRRAIACTEAEWERCWPLIEKYWRRDGDALVNDTQLEVYREAQERRDRAVARARAGAQATAQARARAHAQASAQAPTQAPAQAAREQVPEHQPPSPSPSPSPEPQRQRYSEDPGSLRSGEPNPSIRSAPTSGATRSRIAK